LFAPAIIQQVGLRWSWLVLLGVFALYVFQQELLLVGLATKPITDQELLSRFESISAKAKAHTIKLVRQGNRLLVDANPIEGE